MRMKNRRTSLIIVAAVLLVTILSVAWVALANPGDLDTSFDGDGIVSGGVGGAGYNPIALQSDDKIVVVGSNGTSPNSDLGLARLEPDGSLDTSFDSDGTVTTDAGANDFGSAIAIQDDGKIVIAGESNAQGNFDFVVARYHPDGSLDTSFDGDGIAFTDFGVGIAHDRAYAVAIQDDGKIVVAGYARGVTVNDFAVVRYCSDGSLDDSINCGATGFGTGGKVSTDIGGNQDQVYSIIIQPDGKIVVGGYSGPTGGYDYALARYCADGTLDDGVNCGAPGFGTGGLVKTDILSGFDDFAYGMALQSDGKIVVAGYNTPTGMHNNVTLARYNPNGSLDTSFDSDGRVVTDINVRDDFGFDVVLQYDGKLVVTGYTINPSGDQDFFVLRYNSDGGLDMRFSGDGKVVTPIGAGTQDRARGAAIQPDGKILVAGVSSGLAMARYTVEEVAMETVGNGATSSALPDVAITNNSGGSCDFTVRRWPVPPGGGDPDIGEMPVHWDITSNCDPINIDLVFSYTDVEVANGNHVTEANLEAYRHVGGDVWSNQGGVVDTGGNTVTLTGVTTLSGWSIAASADPTAISMSAHAVEAGKRSGMGIVTVLIAFALAVGSTMVIKRYLHASLRKIW